MMMKEINNGRNRLQERNPTMTEKLYTLAEARLMIEIERLEREIRRLNGVIVLRDATCGRLNLTIDKTVTAWENRAIEKDNEISKLNAWIDELINKGNAVSNVYKKRYDSTSREIIDWEDFIDSIMRKGIE